MSERWRQRRIPRERERKRGEGEVVDEAGGTGAAWTWLGVCLERGVIKAALWRIASTSLFGAAIPLDPRTSGAEV